MIVSHTHSDHATDVSAIIQQTHAKLVGSHSLETLIAISGMPEHTTVCQGGEKVVLSEQVEVTMVPSAHGKALLNKVPLRG